MPPHGASLSIAICGSGRRKTLVLGKDLGENPLTRRGRDLKVQVSASRSATHPFLQSRCSSQLSYVPWRGASPIRLAGVNGPVARRRVGHHRSMPTDLLYLRDASLRSFEATVVETGETGVVLDRTAFYVTGGGQPHDTGVLRWDAGEARVVDVRKHEDGAWHTLEGDIPPWAPR